MTHILKTDTVYIPFKLIQVGQEYVLVPDMAMESHVKSRPLPGARSKVTTLNLNSGHIKQVYVASAHVPEELIRVAESGNVEQFAEVCKMLGHSEPLELLKTVRERLCPMQDPFVNALDFDRDENFFDQIF